MCFGQFGPYHHARVAALQQVGREHGPVEQAAPSTGRRAWSDTLAEDCKLNTDDCRHG